MILSLMSLSSCSGCQMALVNLGVPLLDILKGNKLGFVPILADGKSMDACDLALVEGCVRNDQDAKHLEEIRSKSKKLIAFGTCASFGGIPGLGSAFKTPDLLSQAYPADFVPTDIPSLQPRVYPIDHFVEVDYFLPGCPPPRAILLDAIPKLLAGQEPKRVDLPVCAECGRIASHHAQPTISRTAVDVPQEGECLLSQGFVCLGSVSRSGCGATCTEVGVPCWGCRGPIDRVLVEPTHGILFDLTRRISHFTGMSEKEVKAKLPDMLHSLYAFTLSVPEMRRKSSEGIHEHIQRVKV